MNKTTNIILTIACISTLGFSAQTIQAESVVEPKTIDSEIASAYERIINIQSIDIPVPTVVALPLLEQVSRQEKFLVYEVETDTYLSSYLFNNTITQPYAKSVETIPVVSSTFALTDDNLNTATEFSVINSGQDEATIILKTSRSIDTSRLRLHLAQFVALPRTIEIKAGLQESSERFTVVAERELMSTTVTFPKTTADVFEITLRYSQPLRINELYFFDDSVSDEVQQSLRFLAQPNNSYQILYESDRTVAVNVAESGDLRTSQDVLDLFSYSSQANIKYVPADIDEDGIRDVIDNCVRIANPDQIDINNNGRGDVCDDFDGDGVSNANDNCINIPNRAQRDVDVDGIGDACDEEESRFTESNPWIPWIGIGTAVIVILILFVLVARGPKRIQELE